MIMRVENSLLVLVAPDMDDEDKSENDGPAEERARPTRHARVVEEETNADGTEYLGEPITEVVQSPSTDVE